MSLLAPARRILLSRLLIISTILSLVIATIYYSHELYTRGSEPHLIAWFSAGAFVLIGFPISIAGIYGHLSHYYQPGIQVYVVRILWMVPVYSLGSWLCLRFKSYAVLIETFRDAYEAYVIYCFLNFLIQVLGGEDTLVMILKDKSPTRGFHMFPLSMCLKPWIMGQPESKTSSGVYWSSPFYLKCKFGVLQYVLIKILTTFTTVVLQLNGLYTEGSFSPSNGYLYVSTVINVSQCWALYCLAFFYFATKNELSHIRPVGKFLCVKALVFFTWWQSVGVSILYGMGMIPSTASWGSEDVAKGIQDYLICIEMFIGAVVHQFVFHHGDYAGWKEQHYRTGKRRRVGGRKKKRRGKNGMIKSGSDNSIYDSEQDSSDELLSSSPEPGHYEMTRISESNHENDPSSPTPSSSTTKHPPPEPQTTSVMEAFMSSSVPTDVMSDTKKIFVGEFKTTKKTLLYHATTADSNSLFVRRVNNGDHRKGDDNI